MQTTHPLIDRIRQRILASPHQRITFAEFMNLALYDPEEGYYATNQVNIGAGGDFFTSPHLGADFGELLAEQFAEMWHRMQRPARFTLVEMGAGQGLLAQDVLRYLHRHHDGCFEALEYIIVEKASALIAEQQERLQSLARSWGQLHWRTWEEIPPDSIVGCCFSNELVDAFPVHRVKLVEGQLQEIYVGVGEAGEPAFCDRPAPPSTPQLADYFRFTGVDLPGPAYPEGYETEVNLAALDWMATVAARLRQGYVLTIDYGYPAQRYYSPLRREGTLQCYYQHAHHNDPYRYVGQQDITAHVDFTALERQGEWHGLETLGQTAQGLFLMALGLGDRIAALSEADPREIPLQEILRRREALHSLMNPMGLGGFTVLIQGKQLDAAGRLLKGLRPDI